MLDPIKSARRSFEVFEYFQLRQTPLTLSHICGALNYPASSASVLLKSLVSLGYLDYNMAERNYMPTMKIADLGGWVQNVVLGDGRIARAMNDLSEKFGETVTLAVQSDLYAQYLYLIQSRKPIWYPIPIGTLRPLTGSGSGLMMLSRMRDVDVRKIVKRINFHRLDKRRPTAADVIAQLRCCREDGYIFSRHLIEQGAGGVSVLLEDRRFGRSYALGVHGSIDRLEPVEQEVVQALLLAVRAASPQ